MQKAIWIIIFIVSSARGFCDSLIQAGDTLTEQEKREKYVNGYWNIYDKSGKLIRKEIRSDGKVVKEIDYSTGKPAVTIDKPVSAFAGKHTTLLFIIILLPLFLRIPINSIIYKREGYKFTKPMEGRIATAFTFWWVNFKPENRALAIANNILSVAGLGVFVFVIVCTQFLEM
jgi:hypothetical protein